MEDKNIVKALECCINTDGTRCGECKFFDGYNLCIDDLQKDSLDLINRQKAEIAKCEKVIDIADKTIATQKAEIERLKRKLVAYEPSVDSGLFSQMLLEQKEKAEAFEKKWKAEVKAEAYREFAERLKAKDEINNLGDGYVTIEDVTETYKELVGEDDA